MFNDGEIWTRVPLPLVSEVTTVSTLTQPLPEIYIAWKESFIALTLRLFLFSENGKSVLSQIGKFGVTCAFAIIYVYAAELFPTVLRTTGMGMCSVMARVGSILAPIVGRELVTLYWHFV